MFWDKDKDLLETGIKQKGLGLCLTRNQHIQDGKMWLSSSREGTTKDTGGKHGGGEHHSPGRTSGNGVQQVQLPSVYM